MNDKISFNINNGDKQIWEQSEHDNSVKLYTLVNDWTEENTISIPAGDMVMLANLYRTIKDNDITNPYINPNGSMQPATGEDLSKAVEKQIPKKPVAFERTAPNLQSETCPYSHYKCEYIKPFSHEYKYTDYKCPSCNKRVSDGTPNYCCHCGQALDWRLNDD